MLDYELNNSDPEDIEDVLIKVEKSFNIKFIGNELIGLSTFGELCDHITNKIQLAHSVDCTKQQAFYKLRNAISSTLNIHDIKPNTLLSHILPRKERLSRVKLIEKKLGFRLSLLRPKYFISNILLIIFITSLVELFINWKWGFVGFIIIIITYQFAKKFSKEIDIITIGELTEKIARENYLESRRNPTTFNKNEIQNILTECFSKDLGLDKSKLTRDAKF
jgi:hypothetical protein